MAETKDIDSSVHKAVYKAFSKAYTSMARHRSSRPNPLSVRDVTAEDMEVQPTPPTPQDQWLKGD
jgi:hypothetical protein